MKVGIIAPISSLRNHCTTEIQYCLPRLLVKEASYLGFYRQKVDEGNLVILDTKKMGWQRQPEDISIVEEALSLIDPSLVITPSHMYNVSKTLSSATNFLNRLHPSGVVGCLEGTNREEIEECARALKEMGIKTLAIPSHLYRTVTTLEHNGPTIYLDNNLNIQELDGREGILVTSLPIRLGLRGSLLSDYLPSPPALTLYEEEKFPKIIKRNIKEMLKFYGN